MRAKNPKGRSTDATVDIRLDEMLHVLSARPTAYRSQLNAEFCKRWSVDWRTVDRYVRRAREEIMKRSGRPKESFRCESLAFYESKSVDPNVSSTDQLRARENIDKLLGLNAPAHFRQEVSGPGGGKIVLEHKTKEPFDFDEFKRLQQSVLGVPSGHGSGEPIHPAHTNGEASGVSDADRS